MLPTELDVNLEGVMEEVRRELVEGIDENGCDPNAEDLLVHCCTVCVAVTV